MHVYVLYFLLKYDFSTAIINFIFICKEVHKRNQTNKRNFDLDTH